MPFLACLSLLPLLVGTAGPAAAAPPQAPALAGTHPAGFPIAALAPGVSPASVPWLRQVPVRTARLRGVPRMEPIDGMEGTSLPLSAPLEVEFAQSAPVAYVELQGGGHCSLRCDEQAIPMPVAGSTARLLLAEPAKRRKVVVVPEAGAPLAEARFFERRNDPPPPPDLPMTPAQAAGDPPAIRLSTGPLAQSTGAAAVLLDIELQAPFPESLHARLTQSAEADRAWLQADLRLEAEPGTATGRWVVLLDPPDTWCDAGESITLTLSAAAAPVVRKVGAGVVSGTPDEVRIEAALSRLHWLSAWYTAHAIEAPWDAPGWAPEREPAMRWLAALREWQPRHPATIAYTCRLLKPRREVHVPAPGPENAPAWARLARQLLKRTQDVAYGWNGTRLQKDGLYGGDPWRDATLVEKLATVPLIAGHPVLLRSTRAGCEGLWRAAGAAAGGEGDSAIAAWIGSLGAEERRRWLLALAQTQSLLMLADPGSAMPLRRMLPLATDLAGRIEANARGHRHLRLATGEARVPPDVPGNAAAAGPALAYFWHSGHPAVGRAVGQWASAWAADLLNATDALDPGKVVAGVDPIDCRVVEGRAAPVEANALLRLLLDAHRITGNADILRPVSLAVGAGRADPLITALWRLSGGSAQDQAILEAAGGADDLRSYAAWLASRNKQILADGLQQALDRLDAERYLAAEASLPPEAVEIPGDLLLRFLYLGGCATWQGGMPRLAVTWEKTGVDFAALVAESRRDALKVLLYHFRPEERPVQMRVWGLRAGRYLLEAGPDDDYDDVTDHVTDRRVVDLERGTAVPVTLPAQRPYVLRLAAKALRPDTPLPDVALCADEVRLSPDRCCVSVTVRNFGTAPATNVRVAVTDERSQPIGSAVLARLPWPRDLRPAAAVVEVPLKRPAPSAFRVTATLAGKEISAANNAVVVAGYAPAAHATSLRTMR